jgi:hypothetical protein
LNEGNVLNQTFTSQSLGSQALIALTSVDDKASQPSVLGLVDRMSLDTSRLPIDRVVVILLIRKMDMSSSMTMAMDMASTTASAAAAATSASSDHGGMDMGGGSGEGPSCKISVGECAPAYRAPF